MSTESENKKKSRVNWDDPSVPVGNSPPMPRWPLVVSTIAWLAWVVFLIVMLASRYDVVAVTGSSISRALSAVPSGCVSP